MAVVDKPLGGACQGALLRRRKAVRHFDQQYCRRATVCIRDNPSQAGGPHFRGETRRPIGVATQAAHRQLDQERTEGRRARGRLLGRRAHGRNAKTPRPVEPFGTGQPTRKQRNSGLFQLIEERIDLTAYLTSSCKAELHNGGSPCWQRIQCDTKQLRISISQVTDLLHGRRSPPPRGRTRPVPHERRRYLQTSNDHSPPSVLTCLPDRHPAHRWANPFDSAKSTIMTWRRPTPVTSPEVSPHPQEAGVCARLPPGAWPG